MPLIRKLRKIVKYRVFFTNKKNHRNQKLAWNIYLLLNVAYFLYFWIAYIVYMIRTPENVSGTIVVYFVFSKTTSILSMTIIKLREKKLTRILEVIITTLRLQAPRRYLFIKRKIPIVAVLVAIYLTVMCTMSSLFGLTASSGRMYAMHSLRLLCMGCEPLEWSPATLKAMIVLDAIGYVCFSLGLFLIFCVLFILLTYGLKHLADLINEQLRRMNDDENILKESIALVRERIDVLRDLVDQTNECLQTWNVIWFVGSLIFACLGLTKIISHWHATPGMQSWVLPYVVIDNFECTFMVTLGILMASKIPATVEKGLPFVHKMAEKAVKLKMIDQIQMLHTQISSPAIAINVGGCTIITKQLLISYLGLLITYVVVYLQMSPELLQKLQNLRLSAFTNVTGRY